MLVVPGGAEEETSELTPSPDCDDTRDGTLGRLSVYDDDGYDTVEDGPAPEGWGLDMPNGGDSWGTRRRSKEVSTEPAAGSSARVGQRPRAGPGLPSLSERTFRSG